MELGVKLRFTAVLLFFSVYLTHSASAQTCEAVGFGKCYYIALNGSTGNPGTFALPFVAFSQAGSVLKPGDYLYYRGGTYTNVASLISYDINLNGAAGERITIKSYPGEHVYFDNQGRGSSVIYVKGEGAIIEGFEYGNGTTTGPKPAGSADGWNAGAAIWGSYTIFRNNHCHDIYQNDNTQNGGCIRVQGASFVDIYDNWFEKWWSDGSGAQHNTQAIILFSGGSKNIYRNFFDNSDKSKGQQGSGCIWHKHGNTSGSVIVAENFFLNCNDWAFETGGINTTFRHNIIVDSYLSFYGGGSGSLTNIIWEYNTIYTSRLTAAGSGLGLPANSNFRRNIVFQKTPPTGDNQTLRLAHYGSDSDLQNESYSADNNCYFVSGGSIKVSWFGAVSGGSAGSLGGVYTGLSAWKNSGEGKDANSIETNPLFVDPIKRDFRTQAVSPCSNMGVYASTSPGQPPLTPAEAIGRAISSPPAAPTGLILK